MTDADPRLAVHLQQRHKIARTRRCPALGYCGVDFFPANYRANEGSAISNSTKTSVPPHKAHFAPALFLLARQVTH